MGEDTVKIFVFVLVLVYISYYIYIEIDSVVREFVVNATFAPNCKKSKEGFWKLVFFIILITYNCFLVRHFLFFQCNFWPK